MRQVSAPLLVRTAGVEPARESREILSLLRLPVSPRPQPTQIRQHGPICPRRGLRATETGRYDAGERPCPRQTPSGRLTGIMRSRRGGGRSGGRDYSAFGDSAGALWRRALATRPHLRPASIASWLSAENDLLALGTFAPPLRPAFAANSGSRAKLRESRGTDMPPRRAISRRRSTDMEAKPRFEIALNSTPVKTLRHYVT